jgi:excisionase family DNA binding protein
MEHGPSTAAIRNRLTITPAQAAAELNISRSQVYVLMSRGELPSLKIGRRRIILWDDLIKYLQSLRDTQSSQRSVTRDDVPNQNRRPARALRAR